MREISVTELREWYETKTIPEVMAHFEFNHRPQLYKQLDRAGIPRKRTLRPRRFIRLVD